MIVSEKEAATKWCPMVRAETRRNSDAPASNCIAPSTDGGEGNRNPPWARCLGSGCMFWKVEVSAGSTIHTSDESAERLLRDYPGRFRDDGKAAASARKLTYLESIGRCGVAGVA